MTMRALDREQITTLLKDKKATGFGTSHASAIGWIVEALELLLRLELARDDGEQPRPAKLDTQER